MPLNPNILLQATPPQFQLPDPNAGLNSLAKIMQIGGAMDEQRLNSLLFQEKQRDVADQAAVREALGQPGADPYQVLLGRGRVKEATEFQKAQAAAAKDKAETDAKLLDMAHKRVDSWGQAMGFVRQNPTPENAVAAVRHLVNMGIMPADQAQAALAAAQQHPQGIAGWATQGFQTALQAKDQLPKYDTRNLGGTTQMTAADPVTGQVRVVNSVANTQSPDNAATNARIAADAAAARGQAERHFQVGQANAMSRPFEVTGPDGQAVLVQQDKAGNIVPVQGYAPKGGGKPLPGAALKQITEVRDNANTIDRLATSFKDDYAGKGVLGFGADAQLQGAAVLGKDQDAVEWWKNYRKQAELVERHALFGAALTPGEQASWRGADIAPGMDPKTIKRNLATRQALTARMLDTTRQDLIDAGHSEQRVNAIAGRGPGGTTAPPATPGIDALLKKYGGK